MTSIALEPWESHPEIWKNQGVFFTYLRGAIRSIWSRYPAKLKWKQSQLVAPGKGYTGRAKKLGTCHYCKEMFSASALEVDHVQQAGSCNSWETAYEFLRKLLDCNNNWVLACKPCHKVKSYAERTGLDFKDALAEKRAIDFLKTNSKQVVLDYCASMGYNVGPLTNNQKRREALVAIFKKETDE